jgi:hypothetical protein
MGSGFFFGARSHRAFGVLLVAVFAACIGVGLMLSQGSSGAVRWRRELHPQTTWAACSYNARNGKPSTFRPLSDAQAAALVTPEPETRPDNDKPYTLDGRPYASLNSFVPTEAAIQAFRRAKTSLGQTEVQFNPYLRYVDGQDGLHDPSTDDLIQWAAHKWGIPENWLRAEYVEESYWNGFMLGDLDTVAGSWVPSYPSQARVSDDQVYESMGLAQVRWAPNGSVDPGAEPLRWESTAFNIDYQAAMVRFYYDNPGGTRSEWGDKSYEPCQEWESIGGWNSPYPWHNSEQQLYIGEVQHWLSARQWLSSSFINWSPSSLPPGIKLNR